jgi:branched-chain amino acid transport system substrate-binding protein
MKQAASIQGLQLPMVIEGIKVNTSATDFYPLQSVRLARFEGEVFKPFGPVISAEAASN